MLGEGNGKGGVFSRFTLGRRREHACETSSKGREQQHMPLEKTCVPLEIPRDLGEKSCVSAKIEDGGSLLDIPRKVSSLNRRTQEILGCKLHTQIHTLSSQPT